MMRSHIRVGKDTNIAGPGQDLEEGNMLSRGMQLGTQGPLKSPKLEDFGLDFMFIT